MHIIKKLIIILYTLGIFATPYIYTASPTESVTLSEHTQAHLAHAIEHQMSPFWIFMLAFLAGLLVSFTPCLYPMIPIDLGILQAQATQSAFRNFLLSFTYVLGIATVYSILGYIVATTSLIFGSWFSNPLFILFMVLFFLYFAGSMFGFYEIYIPRFLLNQQTISHAGSLVYSFIAGMLSGLVASPCSTPTLALVLGFVAQNPSPLVGFFTLFFFSLGMGMLLMTLGTFSGLLPLLPQAGSWMLEIKKGLGFLMLATCAYLIGPFTGKTIEWCLYCLVAVSAAAYYFIKFYKQTPPPMGNNHN